MNELGIKSEIKHKFWDYPPMPVIEKKEEMMEDSDDDDDVEESIEDNEQLHQTLQNEVNDDALTIENATDAILVSPNKAFKKVQNVTTSLPIYMSTITTTKSKERNQFFANRL